MSYKNCCRTCLGSSSEMRNINSIITISGDDICLVDILQNFYAYKVQDDEFPQNICINCVNQLTLTYSFKTLVEASIKTLSQNLNHVESQDYPDCPYESEEDYKDHEKPIKRWSKKQKVTANIESREEKYNDNYSLIFCVECKAEFNSTKGLYDHCINTHPIKSNIGRECEFCVEKFDDFRSLVLHRKLHLKPYLCENCWEGFFNIEDLQTHPCRPNQDKSENLDKSEKQLRQCDQCGKSYPAGYIRIHMLTHGNSRPYSCKYCPKKFKVPGGLHSHILWNHKRTRNHKCEVCNATFISSSSRSSHIRKNHLKEKKYGCESCGKRFFSKSELQRHSLTHTGVKNFHCHLCDKSYQTRYGLNVHLKSHSQMSMGVMNL